MKKRWVLFFAIALMLSGCEELSQTYSLKDLGDFDFFQQYMAEKNLVISEFLDGSDNKTGDFEDYTFIFTTTGSISSVYAGDTVKGTWTIFEDDSIPKMLINFGEAGKPLDELNEDWVVLTQSEEKIELKDLSNDGGVEYLTFKEL